MYAWYDQLKDQNYDQTCGVYDSHGDNWFTLAIIEFGVLLMALIYVLVKWLEKNTIPHAPKKQMDDEENEDVPPVVDAIPENKQSLLSE